jgi:hypothetical protein
VSVQRRTAAVLSVVVLALLLVWCVAIEDFSQRGSATDPATVRASTPSPHATAVSASIPAPAERVDTPPHNRDPAATSRVEGIVLDNLGGPIEGAHIAARQQATRHALPVAFARSDEHGWFTLWLRPNRIPEHASSLWLNARAEGYAEATVFVRAPTRAVRIELFAESVLAGVVETESGEPVAGVAVELGPPPLSLLPSWPRAVTDARGRFEFRQLAPGSYRPFVSDGRWHAQLERIELGFVERREDLRIVVSAGHHVRVDVRAPDGTQCLEPHARMVGVERDGGNRDEDGFVTLAAIPSGVHRLVAGCEGALEVEQQVEVTADSTFEITTAEGLIVRGRTIDERGEPVPGALVRADPARSGLAHGNISTESDQSGEFELQGLAPGKVLVTAARSDRVSPPPVELELLADSHTPPFVELQLERGHCISGHVEGGPAELVVVAGDGQRSITYLRLSAERRFELCGFESEGRVWLEDGAGVRAPFVHDATEVQQLALRFPAASERSLELRVVADPDRTIQIRVEADGAPVDEALVRVGPASGPRDPLICGRPFPIMVINHGVTDDGAVSFEELWPGYYYVHAEAEGAQGCAIVSLDERSPATIIGLTR